jgi:hypothetical protein
MFKIATIMLMMLTLALIAFTPMTMSAQEQKWSANDTILSGDAIILTLRMQEGIWLDTTLAIQIDNALEAVRDVYDTLAFIHARRDFIPHELLLMSSAPWTQAWREDGLVTGNETIDSLSTVYHLIDVRFSIPQLNVFTLTFEQPLKIPVLCSVYEAVPEVGYAEPNHLIGDGSTIIAFFKEQMWHFVFSLRWGDCPAGCIFEYNWYIEVDQGLVPRLIEEGFPPSSPVINLWNVPARYAATVFNTVDELFAAAQFASEWWVRRHAVEVIGRLFIWVYPWVGEDLENRELFDVLKAEVLSRRDEVVRILLWRMEDVDPDVRSSANTAFNRINGFPEGSLTFYYPLHVGNSWTFGSHTETIMDTQRIDGLLYFLFHDGDLKRLTYDNRLVVREDSTDRVWVDFSANVGDRWRAFDFFDVVLSSKDAVVEVPAGTFTNCYTFVFNCGSDCGMTEWYAPGVGLVQYWVYGFIINPYELTSAVIDGVTIPSPKGDVDGNGQMNVNDVLVIVNIITGHVEPAPDQYWAADMNDDGRIDVLDVVELIRDILGFPFEKGGLLSSIYLEIG